MITVQSFVFNPFSENTYVVYDETNEALIIDPGCYAPQEQKALSNFIQSSKLKVKLLLNTHCHIDHVLGNDFVKTTYHVPLLIPPLEENLLRAVKAYAPNYGFANYRETEPDQWLNEGDEITWGNSQLKVLALPGHSPGHIGLYSQAQQFVLSGDVLFQGSIGRTDLPGGDLDTLIESIHKKLFVLPDEIVVHAGHGDDTTLGEEKRSNPFCALPLD